MCRTAWRAAASVMVLVSSTAHAQSVNMGDTFHALEARAVRVTTTFPDATIEVRRGAGHAADAVLKDDRGTVRGRLQVPAGSRRVQWLRDGREDEAQGFDLPEQTVTGLDWAAYQLYALWTDHRAQAAEGRVDLEVGGDGGTWEGHLRRDRRALGRGSSAGQIAARAVAVETEFDHLVVRAELDRHVRRPSTRRVDYSRFTAAIRDKRTGAARGVVRWFDTAQVLTWKIEGGSSGVILPERMRGGWTFTPTMAWANVQAYQFATQVAREVAPVDAAPLAAAMRNVLAPRASSAPLAQLVRYTPGLDLVAPGAISDTPWPSAPLRAPWRFGGGGVAFNEEGCDNLHWLDGSIFRVCCDVHDRCYETKGCDSSSWWWPFSGSWSCQQCNVSAAYCFCTVANPAYCGGGAGGGGSAGGGGGGGGGCTSGAGGFCPAECATCIAR